LEVRASRASSIVWPSHFLNVTLNIRSSVGFNLRIFRETKSWEGDLTLTADILKNLQNGLPNLSHSFHCFFSFRDRNPRETAAVHSNMEMSQSLFAVRKALSETVSEVEKFPTI
jgi:hypothetical protein